MSLNYVKYKLHEIQNQVLLKHNHAYLFTVVTNHVAHEALKYLLSALYIN